MIAQGLTSHQPRVAWDLIWMLLNAFFQRLVRIRSRVSELRGVGAAEEPRAVSEGRWKWSSCVGDPRNGEGTCADEHLWGRGLDAPVMRNWQATRRKWVAVGVGYLPFGENRIKWSSKYPEREEQTTGFLSEYLTLFKREHSQNEVHRTLNRVTISNLKVVPGATTAVNSFRFSFSFFF